MACVSNGGRPKSGHDVAFELIVAGLALTSIVLAQVVLSTAVHGTTYRGPDGGMVETTVFTAWKFGGVLNVTSINPLQGLGNQLFTKNAWANPAFWPFALFDRETAADLSSPVALAIYATACYAMARSFDLAVIPSAFAAQLCILIFSPVLFMADTPRNFSPTPADAVTYAPYMVALGLIARLGATATLRRFLLVTVGVSACLLFSIYCDPAFTLIPGLSWSVAFATATLLPLHLRGILARGAAVASSMVVLLVSGAGVYLYALAAYSSRGQYAAAVDRARILGQATHFQYYSNMRYFYVTFLGCWLLGLLFARGRVRVFIITAALSWWCYVAYATIYLLVVDVAWLPPIPLYVEQSLFVLFMAASVAGFWAFLQCLWHLSQRLHGVLLERTVARERTAGASTGKEPRRRRIGSFVGVAVSLVVIFLLPAKMATLARPEAMPFNLYWPWANEPELVQFLTDKLALEIGRPFRGSVNFLSVNEDGTIDDLWSRGVPSLNEYSQTNSAPSLYFTLGLLPKTTPQLNRFHFGYSDKYEYLASGGFPPNYWRATQLLGVHYVVGRLPYLPDNLDPGNLPIFFAYHAPNQPGFDEPAGPWAVYELPHPNLGDYSPTKVIVRRSGAEIMLALSRPDIDFAKQVVLTAPLDKPLVPARDVRMSFIRDGLHVSGHSDGASVVILPQQFSHCLQATDANVQVVRADLLLSGVVFSGNLDTDIFFHFGMFSPWCRLADLSDIKALNLKIDYRRPDLVGDRIFPPWTEGVARLKAAARGLNLIAP